MTKHVVMFSGGIGSWATAKIVAERFGTQDLYLLFSDVKGGAESPHIGEDEDTYRFIDDALKNIGGGTYVYLNEGRDIWTLFSEQNFLGNSRVANCSKILKQRPARAWLKENADPADSIIYVGIDWTETHRMGAIVKNYLPYKAEAPLTEYPYYDKNQLIEWANREGLKTPRLYELGFAHNNCGGGCVRAGQGQFKKLLDVMPERFDVWEQKENELRDQIGKDVAILREMVDGVRKPLPLTVLRQRIEQQPSLIDSFDIGACGCFVDDEDETEGDE
jgi:hypothetical protein